MTKSNRDLLIEAAIREGALRVVKVRQGLESLPAPGWLELPSRRRRIEGRRREPATFSGAGPMTPR